MMKRILFLSFAVATLATSALAHEGKSHPPGDKHDAKAPASPAAPAAPASPASSAAPGHAAGDHAHDSPHGGIVATVDKDTHVEIVFADKSFGVYFYDANMKPVALPTDAKATVVIGKDVKKLDLPIAKKPDGAPDDHLVGELGVAAGQKAAIVIQATVLGKARSARVEKPAAPAAPTTPTPAPTPTKGTP